MVLTSAWPLVPALATTGLVLLTGLWTFSRYGLWRRFAPAWRRVVLLTGVVLLLPQGAILVEGFAYEPVKFAYLVHRIESAATPEAERNAFALADRWGCLWESNRLTERQWWPERAQALQGEWLLELEWIESSAWTGQPYRAYRIVLDESNLEALIQQEEKPR